jgi:predicted DNA-binding WGR domain protein
MNFKFIGWCKEGNHDKVWGVVFLEPPPAINGYDYFPTSKKVAVFWGRRGKALQHRIAVDSFSEDFEKLIRQKERKGYREIDSTRLNEVYPEFQSDLEQTTVWAILKS